MRRMLMRARVHACAGIAKGVRRIVAVTRDEAQRAIAEGVRLEGLVAAAAQHTDMAELDKALSACRQVRRGRVCARARG